MSQLPLGSLRINQTAKYRNLLLVRAIHCFPNQKPKLPMALLCLIFLFMISGGIPSTSGNDSLTAYEALQEYNFPVGLLPNDVLGYELDSSTGKFSVYLNGSCSFSVDSYELKYKSKITGIITEDKLSSLTGIEVKVLFFWLSIQEVTRDEDELKFSVGIASADFSVDNFAESPTCGCGFDCAGKSSFDSFVSAS